jgi:hypothetical protein
MLGQHRQLAQHLTSLSIDELHAFDLQLTLLRTSYVSYKRETVFKPCPVFLQGLDDDELVRRKYQ